MTPFELVERLRERAATADRNADAYEASGYLGEALLCRAKANAFRLAVEDAELVAKPKRCVRCGYPLGHCCMPEVIR